MYCICISVINPFPVLLDCGNEVCFGCKFLCLFWNNYGSIIRMLPWKKNNWNISFKYSHCIKDYSMWLLLFNFTMCHGHVCPKKLSPVRTSHLGCMIWLTVNVPKSLQQRSSSSMSRLDVLKSLSRINFSSTITLRIKL